MRFQKVWFVDKYDLSVKSPFLEVEGPVSATPTLLRKRIRVVYESKIGVRKRLSEGSVYTPSSHSSHFYLSKYKAFKIKLGKR